MSYPASPEGALSSQLRVTTDVVTDVVSPVGMAGAWLALVTVQVKVSVASTVVPSLTVT